MWITFLSRYWQALIIGGAIAALVWYVMSLRLENAELRGQITTMQIASEALQNEYTNNIIQFNEKKAITEIVYRDKTKVIERRVDANSSCEDVLSSFDNYVY